MEKAIVMSTREFREKFTMVPRVYHEFKDVIVTWLPVWISPNGMGITSDELILTALYCLSGKTCKISTSLALKNACYCQ